MSSLAYVFEPPPMPLEAKSAIQDVLSNQKASSKRWPASQMKMRKRHQVVLFLVVSIETGGILLGWTQSTHTHIHKLARIPEEMVNDRTEFDSIRIQ